MDSPEVCCPLYLKQLKIRIFFALAMFILSASNHIWIAAAAPLYEKTALSAQTESRPVLQAAAPSPSSLHALSAVLMDGETGRILYEKNGDEVRPMASTTKIMTGILALELGEPEQEIPVSKLAAVQPKVHLGMNEGETYRLEDLLYSLLLESHNDSAVAVAEAIGGSVEGFAALMNEKAEAIGCHNTCFLTPNGLDETMETETGIKIHSTTAKDLARIMRYCVMESPKREAFRTITKTSGYGFMANGRSFSCQNHNAFLQMMDGAFSGKTGFTGEAGYCYVGALERDGRTFIVSLLACGWPNNKSYKWSDTKALMSYGLEEFENKTFPEPAEAFFCPVEGGIPESGDLSEQAQIRITEQRPADFPEEILLGSHESITRRITAAKTLTAPITSSQTVGQVEYRIGDQVTAEAELHPETSVEALTFSWCAEKTVDLFLLHGGLGS